MGLTSPMIKYLVLQKKLSRLSGPLLTFGNQDIYATEHDMEKWLKDQGVVYNKPGTIRYSTSAGLQKINEQAKKYIHAATMFEYLGIEQNDYYDIDKFDFDMPKIVHDLQEPMPKKYYNYFNFVIDSGTLEHIFDVKTVMENIVNITKIGGYALLIIPAKNFLNHGFYQFCPTFFYDFLCRTASRLSNHI